MQMDPLRHVVFLSHAGAQKRIVVDYIYSSFAGSGISVFLDQHSLQFGRTQDDMRGAVDSCCVGELPVAAACLEPSARIAQAST
jgi:hypothetical protein